jgi:DNA-3-methyladenine glycosylase I
MDTPKSYCQAIAHLDDLHKAYHDTEYGFPIEEDNAMFGRLILEINQAGLSWTTILKKKDHFKVAYSGFDIDTIASYDESEKQRLLSDPGVIRNKLKVNAAIHNAQVILGLREEHGSFKAWLDHHHPLTRVEWVKLFKKTFKFTGGEITNEFLLSTGYLPGAHDEDCPIYKEVLKRGPKWSGQ